MMTFIHGPYEILAFELNKLICLNKVLLYFFTLTGLLRKRDITKNKNLHNYPGSKELLFRGQQTLSKAPDVTKKSL